MIWFFNWTDNVNYGQCKEIRKPTLWLFSWVYQISRELSRTSGFFPRLLSPGKCQNRIPGLCRFSRSCTNPEPQDGTQSSSLKFSIFQLNKSSTQDHEWPHFQTPRNSAKILCFKYDCIFNSLPGVWKWGQTQSLTIWHVNYIALLTSKLQKCRTHGQHQNRTLT